MTEPGSDPSGVVAEAMHDCELGEQALAIAKLHPHPADPAGAVKYARETEMHIRVLRREALACLDGTTDEESVMYASMLFGIALDKLMYSITVGEWKPPPQRPTLQRVVNIRASPRHPQEGHGDGSARR